jgi:hypothetical protein
MTIRIRSHRARQSMRRILERDTASFFSFYTRGEWHEVSDEEYQLVRHVPGITRARVNQSELIGHISFA